MLLMGALSGAVAESLNRKYLLMAGQVLTALGAISIATLSALGWLSLWHLWMNGLIGGLVWTNELATRRRMVAETAGPERIVPAVAFDTTTGSTTRMLGPMLGGVLYETLGVTAAYGIASVIILWRLAWLPRFLTANRAAPWCRAAFLPKWLRLCASPLPILPCAPCSA